MDICTLKKKLVKRLAYLCDDSAPFGGAPGMNAFLRLLRRDEISGEFVVRRLRTAIWGGGEKLDYEALSRSFWNDVFGELQYESLSLDEREAFDLRDMYADDAIKFFKELLEFFNDLPEGDKFVKLSINRWVCRSIAYLDSLNVMNNLANIVFENYEHFYPRKVNDELIILLKNNLPFFQTNFIIKQIDIDVALGLKCEEKAELSKFESELLDVAKRNIARMKQDIYSIVERGGDF